MKKLFVILIMLDFFFCSSLKEIQEISHSRNEETTLYPKKALDLKEQDTYYQDHQPTIQYQPNIYQKKEEKRQIIYESRIELQVKKIEETIQIIKKYTESYKGYIEVLENRKDENSSYLKIRIPVEHFFGLLDQLFLLGNVKKHSIFAEDVSKNLQDVESRIKTLKHLRNRLYELFQKATKVDEKAKILKEINRLTSEIEELEATQEYLKNKSTYSTIELFLKTGESWEKPIFLTSPFLWIQNLNPLQRTIFNEPQGFFSKFFVKNTFYTLLNKIKVPETFFNNKENFIHKKEPYLLYSPLSVGIRLGVIPNEPYGTSEFWTKAIQEEFKKRNYELISEKKENNIKYLSFKINDGIRVYYYEIQIFTIDEEVAIIEIFYPNESAYNQMNSKIKNLL